LRGPVASADYLVRKGDQVELVVSSSAFSVSTIAIADQDGAIGDRIRVRAGPRTPAIIGVVNESGQILLPQFK
jgi:flagella basal body P-ring formation protein FlgA